MDSRQERGRQLAQDPRIRQIEGPLYFVPSQKAGGYLVDIEAGRCQCADHTGQNVKCKHLHAVEIVRAGLVAGDGAQVPLAFPPAPPKQPKSDLTAEEQACVRVALRYLRTRSGGWDALAKGLRFNRKTLEAAAYGGCPSASLTIRLARFAGAGVDDLLTGKYPPACPHCGQKMPAVQN